MTAAVKVFQNKQFRYTNIINSNNFTYAEFEAKFGNILVNGIDIIKIKNNLIIEFKVFLRPLKGIEIVWKEMRESLRKTWNKNNISFLSNINFASLFSVKHVF